MRTRLTACYLLRFLTVFCLPWLCCPAAKADHILGGNIEMVALDAVPGRYLLRLIVFQNEENGVSGHVPDTQGLMIFRTRDNKKMQFIEVKLANSGKTDVVYFNDKCSAGRRLKTGKLILEAEIRLAPQEYDDPGGYYVIWSNCCRDATIANILRPVKTAIVFQLKFPPLLRDGQPFLNSSAAFKEINGEYLCVNTPFMLNFDATDRDGDELGYSLVTPFDSYTQSTNLDEGQYIGMSAYPPVKWVKGHGPANVMNGNPELAIDRRTGVLTVTPTQLGLFVFTVQVDEYRRGKWIGSTRRDYQFLVIDCPSTTPPEPQVRIAGFPEGITEGTICKGSEIELIADNAPDWMYQWRKDGHYIQNATGPVLKVAESGIYGVDIAFKTVCGRSVKSREVRITVVGAEAKIDADARTVCKGKPVELSTASVPGLVYTWFLNGSVIPGARSAYFRTEQEGIYTVRVLDPALGCPPSESPPTEITALKSPSATITASATTACEGEIVTLSAPEAAGNKYRWLRNGTPVSTSGQLEIKEDGSYTVLVTDSAGCREQSAPFSMRFTPQVKANLLPLPVFCEGDTGSYPLQGTPAGGTYSGPGLAGNRFVPALAGKGVHEISYTLSGALACEQSSTTQKVRVQSPPGPALPSQIAIYTSAGVVLPGNVGPSYTYRWWPADGLEAPDLPNPRAAPEKTTVYKLVITDANGCQTTAYTEVIVETRLAIPTSFTPNNDGLNDVWELKGLHEQAELEVSVYDRWGKQLFHSVGYARPWDGKNGTQPVPAGSYPYRIRLAGRIYTGVVAVLY